jgi:hypothetical protein
MTLASMKLFPLAQQPAGSPGRVIARPRSTDRSIRYRAAADHVRARVADRGRGVGTFQSQSIATRAPTIVEATFTTSLSSQA